MTSHTAATTPDSLDGLPAFFPYIDTLGFWRWHLSLPNGRRLADSGEYFRTREECEAAIEMAQASVQAAIVYKGLISF